MNDPVELSVDLDMLEKAVGYSFGNKELLLEAFIHKSFKNENPDKVSMNNQRFEFLGDAVLDLILSQYLIDRFPAYKEGNLSKIRAFLVNEAGLCEIANQIGIGPFLLLGNGEVASGGRTKPSILADAYEALVAAIFLDSNYLTSYRVIISHFTPLFERLTKTKKKWWIAFDPKTQLQEICQNKFKVSPKYFVTAEKGPEHEKEFFVEVKINDALHSKGIGRSKKEAEQEAARIALSELLNGADYK